jgi:hypothetical protein
VNHIKDTLGTGSVDACVEAILLFMRIPNLGMVKAAFCAQMFGFDVACIDSHNIKRLGLPASAVKTPPAKMKPATARKKVAAYVSLTQATGGSAGVSMSLAIAPTSASLRLTRCQSIM